MKTSMLKITAGLSVVAAALSMGCAPDEGYTPDPNADYSISGAGTLTGAATGDVTMVGAGNWDENTGTMTFDFETESSFTTTVSQASFTGASWNDPELDVITGTSTVISCDGLAIACAGVALNVPEDMVFTAGHDPMTIGASIVYSTLALKGGGASEGGVDVNSTFTFTEN